MIFASMNESKRQQKFSRLIQRDFSDIIQKDKQGIFTNNFVTVADVRMSPDLSVAKIYLSMMLVKDKEGLLDKIDMHKSELRRDLGNKIGKQVRIVPELIFYVDEVEERASRIDKLIDDLDIPSEDEDDDKND
ncbi:30S ribosome-binding factor RbfA [Fulvivirga maritima]|uniref:30S ribosome-binding factor RbfA n=1 Tax=Fulvivirga maritima TaxID=2904247 RepID=UPI001F33B64E|nr:30S ribosome-binding factor RbfA [Fulvivirga maritima]UII27883.1 30S ribosome-binding factor RbfA [Fulvivirga maritima]